MVYTIYSKRSSVQEENSGELKTIPDQSLPLSVLLERAQRGQLDVANYFRGMDYDSQYDGLVEHQERPLDSLDALNQFNAIQPTVQTPPSASPSPEPSEGPLDPSPESD